MSMRRALSQRPVYRRGRTYNGITYRLRLKTTGALPSRFRFRRRFSVFKVLLMENFMKQGILFSHDYGLSLGHGRIGQAFD